MKPKSTRALCRDFIQAAKLCIRESGQQDWGRALSQLSTDPLFADVDLMELARKGPTRGWVTAAEEAFLSLSSGHKFALLTVTRLVATVEERTLVLMDEPESHLHPPLLSGLIRAISELMSARNGLAIVATHSPVVAQEVPRSCVWVIRRSGELAAAERPQHETFGENVSTLTHELFGLEIEHSGFHRLIRDAILESPTTYEGLLERFSDQLGTEARTVARGLIATTWGSPRPTHE